MLEPQSKGVLSELPAHSQIRNPQCVLSAKSQEGEPLLQRLRLKDSYREGGLLMTKEGSNQDSKVEQEGSPAHRVYNIRWASILSTAKARSVSWPNFVNVQLVSFSELGTPSHLLKNGDALLLSHMALQSTSWVSNLSS